METIKTLPIDEAHRLNPARVQAKWTHPDVSDRWTSRRRRERENERLERRWKKRGGNEERVELHWQHGFDVRVEQVQREDGRKGEGRNNRNIEDGHAYVSGGDAGT